MTAKIHKIHKIVEEFWRGGGFFWLARIFTPELGTSIEMLRTIERRFCQVSYARSRFLSLFLT